MRSWGPAALAAVLATALLALPATAEPVKAVVVSLDGGGAIFLDKLMAAGKMPNLAAIAQSGVQADYALTNFPSKTAAGHASLWTGCYGRVNGITANEVPLLPQSQHTILERQSGFDSTALLAEPLWVTAARAGRRSLVVQATHETPLAPYEATGRLGTQVTGAMTLVDGYAGQVEPDWVLDSTRSLRPARGWALLPASKEPPLELDLNVGATVLHGLVYDDPADPVHGYDTLQIRPHKESATDAVVLKPGPCEAGTVSKFSVPIPIATRKATTSVVFRLFDLAPDAGSLLLYRSALVVDQTNDAAFTTDLVAHTGALWPRGAEDPYIHGRLGPTLVNGGSGEAEDRLLETIRYAMVSRIHRLKYAAQHAPWDLLINYIPYPDGIEHLWYGLVDDHSAAYRPDIGPKLWPYVEAVAGMVDDFLGAARQVAGDRAVLAVVSDHGMEGLAWDFCPNILLREAGLLAVDRRGHIDLRRTQALYSPNDGAYVVINTTAHKGGIVPPAQVPHVIERVTAVLRRARMPRSKQHVVTGIYQAAEADPSLGLGGPKGGDLYLDVAPGVYFNPSWTGGNVLLKRPPLKSGGHIFNPMRPSMHAIFFLTGPGVLRHKRLPAVRTIDIAPTLCRLMGVPAPAQATGHVLSQALAP